MRPFSIAGRGAARVPHKGRGAATPPGELDLTLPSERPGPARWASVLGRSEGQGLWACSHRAAGDPGLARHHAARALAHATEPRQPLARRAAHRLLGELDTEAGRYARATAHLDTALRSAAACAAPYERAPTLLAQSELRAATSRREETPALLDEARTTCAPLRAAPALGRAEALASRLRDAPPTPPPTPRA